MQYVMVVLAERDSQASPDEFQRMGQFAGLVETKEIIGGFFMLEFESRDEALELTRNRAEQVFLQHRLAECVRGAEG